MIQHNGMAINLKTRTVSHRGATVSFRPIWKAPSFRFKMVCGLILGGPISKSRLFECIYGDCREGGPLAGPQQLAIMFYQIEKRNVFKKLELDMRRKRVAGTYFYSLVPYDQGWDDVA